MFRNFSAYITQSDDEDVVVADPSFTGGDAAAADTSPPAASGRDVENPTTVTIEAEEDTRPSYQLRSMPPREMDEEATCIAIFCSVVGAILLLTTIVLLATSFKKVDETEWGVQYKKYKKELDDAAVTGGLFAGRT